MRTNIASRLLAPRTHEGAPARQIDPTSALRRAVLSCLLWENEFYEDGGPIADRIVELAAAVDRDTVAALAIEARNVHGLRHAPLMLLLDRARVASDTAKGIEAAEWQAVIAM